MSEEEVKRYTRQIIMKDWGVEKQEELKKKHVFVAGAGGAASVILTQLALIGVGHITICDNDTVELSNANRQFIHFIQDDSRIGMNKAVSAKKTISVLNPFIKIDIITEKITENNADDLIRDTDAVFAAVDNFKTMFLLSRMTTKYKIPLFVDGQLGINSFSAMCYPPKGCCFHCLFDEDKVEFAEYLNQFRKEKVMVSSCAPSIALGASFNVLEAVKILIGLEVPSYSKLFFYLQMGEKMDQCDEFKGLTFWFSDYLKEQLALQEFNIESNIYRGKVVEEFNIPRDKQCVNCSKL